MPPVPNKRPKNNANVYHDINIPLVRSKYNACLLNPIWKWETRSAKSSTVVNPGGTLSFASLRFLFLWATLRVVNRESKLGQKQQTRSYVYVGNVGVCVVRIGSGLDGHVVAIDIFHNSRTVCQWWHWPRTKAKLCGCGGAIRRVGSPGIINCVNSQL